MLNFRIEKKNNRDEKVLIWRIIKELCAYNKSRSIDMSSLKARILANGYSEQALEDTIKEYEFLEVLMRAGNEIRVIQEDV